MLLMKLYLSQVQLEESIMAWCLSAEAVRPGNDIQGGLVIEVSRKCVTFSSVFNDVCIVLVIARCQYCKCTGLAGIAFDFLDSSDFTEA